MPYDERLPGRTVASCDPNFTLQVSSEPKELLIGGRFAVHALSPHPCRYRFRSCSDSMKRDELGLDVALCGDRGYTCD